MVSCSVPSWLLPPRPGQREKEESLKAFCIDPGFFVLLLQSSPPLSLSLSLSGSGRHAAPRHRNLGGKMCRRDVLSIAAARPMGSLIFCRVLGRGSGPPANKDIFSGPSPGGARGWRHRGSPGTIYTLHLNAGASNI